MSHPFSHLTPDRILQVIEEHDYACDGRLLPLNSYENRVYQIGIEDEQPLIAKFYRPDRWSAEQILEEHQFCFELCEQELPVVPPISRNGESLYKSKIEDVEFYFALYERKGGHAPELDNEDNLVILGRLLARIHCVGQSKPFKYRPTINVKNYVDESIAFISEHFLPEHISASYLSVTELLTARLHEIFNTLDSQHYIRCHGDCHIGNILWRDDNPHFVDFDDARMAPAIQDIWMMLSGDRQQQTQQLTKILEGYSEFNHFSSSQLLLIEALRTMRMLYYSAWLARRWQDPAFPLNFPWFNSVRYWEEQVLALREQQAALQEPPLQLI